MFTGSGIAQIGIGLGSHGLNVRTNPDSKHGLIIRTGFGFTADPFETFFRPEAAWIKRHHYSDKTKLYAGLGAAGEVIFSVSELHLAYGFIIPVGLELFPLENKRLSVSLETGLSFLDIGQTDSQFGNYGLLEITFYLDHHHD